MMDTEFCQNQDLRKTQADILEKIGDTARYPDLLRFLYIFVHDNRS